MTEKEIRLTRRRILGGLLTVGGASAAAGAGTMAVFSDTESSSGNTVQSGTLDLKLDGGDATVQFLTETDIAPGDSGQATLIVKNTGSLSGYLDIEVASLTNYENGLVGNEGSKDSTGGDPGEGNGELQDNLEVKAYFQDGPSLWSTGFEVISDVLSTGTVYDLDYELAANGGSDTFVLEWDLPGDTGREAQSDSVELALTFKLNQNGGA